MQMHSNANHQSLSHDVLDYTDFSTAISLAPLRPLAAIVQSSEFRQSAAGGEGGGGGVNDTNRYRSKGDGYETHEDFSFEPFVPSPTMSPTMTIVKENDTANGSVQEKSKEEAKEAVDSLPDDMKHDSMSISQSPTSILHSITVSPSPPAAAQPLHSPMIALVQIANRGLKHGITAGGLAEGIACRLHASPSSPLHTPSAVPPSSSTSPAAPIPTPTPTLTPAELVAGHILPSNVIVGGPPPKLPPRPLWLQEKIANSSTTTQSNGRILQPPMTTTQQQIDEHGKGLECIRNSIAPTDEDYFPIVSSVIPPSSTMSPAAVSADLASSLCTSECDSNEPTYGDGDDDFIDDRFESTSSYIDNDLRRTRANSSAESTASSVGSLTLPVTASSDRTSMMSPTTILTFKTYGFTNSILQQPIQPASPSFIHETMYENELIDDDEFEMV